MGPEWGLGAGEGGSHSLESGVTGTQEPLEVKLGLAECSHVRCAIPLFLCACLLGLSACSPRSPSAPG